MRRTAVAVLLLTAACGSAPKEPPPSQTGRRHHVVINSDVVVLDFVLAHGNETIDLLTLNMTRNANANQAPIDLSPLARLKSIHTLSLSGFTVIVPPRSETELPMLAPGFTDRQVEDLGRIRSLRRLDLRGNGLTEGQRSRLKSYLPQCEIREN